MKPSFRMALALALLASSPAAAQMAADVKFAPGNFGTMLSGTVTGNEYFDYRLDAKAGQQLYAQLSVVDTNGNGTIYFNILPPGSDNAAIYIGSNDDDLTTTTALPQNGTYTIRVYLMGNDRDTNKVVGYNLDISIQ